MRHLSINIPVGTRSVLYGAHCFLIHPWFVAAAWWKLYGFPTDWKLWWCFVVHDLGYWGSPNMDGPEGELHPVWAARVTMKLLGFLGYPIHTMQWWAQFILYHSRFLAKQHGEHYSKLCVADKLAIVLEPWWLYLPRVRLTGEILEYKKLAEKKPSQNGGKYVGMNVFSEDDRRWFENVKRYLSAWVEEHKDGVPDTWTPNNVQTLRED